MLGAARCPGKGPAAPLPALRTEKPLRGLGGPAQRRGGVRGSAPALPDHQVTAKLLKALKAQAGEHKDEARAEALGGLAGGDTHDVPACPWRGFSIPGGSTAPGCREIWGQATREPLPVPKGRVPTARAPPVRKHPQDPLLDAVQIPGGGFTSSPARGTPCSTLCRSWGGAQTIPSLWDPLLDAVQVLEGGGSEHPQPVGPPARCCAGPGGARTIPAHGIPCSTLCTSWGGLDHPSPPPPEPNRHK